jgi:PDZ domain-containing protein
LLVALWLFRSAPTPLWEVSPGPVREVAPLIDVAGATSYDSSGRLLLTAVLVGTRPLTPNEAVRAAFEPGVRLVPERDVRPPGTSEAVAERRATSQMDQSKLDATAVVLELLTDYPRERRPGALVESVAPGCPAGDELVAGDLIVEIDGEPVGGRAEAAHLIRAAEPGRPIRFVVRAGGETHELSLARELCGGSDEPIVGVSLLDNFPYTVRIRSGGIGGPSAGLMWALGLYDRLTPGDLTGGRTVAGSGELDLDGEVGGVGSIAQKLAAAERAGAEVFLVPRANLREARRAGVDLEVVPVSTFEEALAALGVEPGT